MTRSTCLPSVSLLVTLALAIPGCAPAAKPSGGIQASGKATLDGTPLEMGLVVLEPEAGGETASGQIDRTGSFTVYDVKPGRYRVGVQTAMFAGMQAQAKKAAATAGDGRPVAVRGLDGTFRAVPAKFEKPATSGIVVDVQAERPIEVTLQGK